MRICEDERTFPASSLIITHIPEFDSLTNFSSPNFRKRTLWRHLTRNQRKMAQTVAVGRALGRSPDVLKRSRVLAAYGFPKSGTSFSPEAAKPTRWYGTATKSKNGPNFLQTNLRANLSRGFPVPSTATTTRYMASISSKIENLVQNNKVRCCQQTKCRPILALSDSEMFRFVFPTGGCFLQVVLSILCCDQKSLQRNECRCRGPRAGPNGKGGR